MMLSDQERRNIIKRSALSISQLQDGEDAIGVLSGIYCGNLPDKSPQQGELMAQELLTWIDHFQQAYDEALDSPEEYLCRTVESLSPESAKQLLAENNFANQVDWESYPARKDMKQAVGERMLLAVTAMVIYTMAKNGELSEAPENLTLGQVTVGVCAENKLTELQWGTEKGYLEKQLAKKQICAVQAVCICAVLAASAIVGVIAWQMGMPVEAVVALCAYVMGWLGLVLGIYYNVTAQMIQDEAEQISCLSIEEIPVEIVEESESQTERKTLPWPDSVPENQNAEEQEQERKKNPANH